MKPVIDPVAADLIENELTPERLLRRTNNGGNEIYVMRAQECPNLMREIGRLRELSFRDGGGGTGADVDIDELDLDPEGYEQLFVWDPKAKGDRPEATATSSRGARIRNASRPSTTSASPNGSATSTCPTRSSSDVRSCSPTIWDREPIRKDFSRSTTCGTDSGALVVNNPDMRYFFGKVTMYGSYDKEARNILLYFLHKYFPDREHLVESIHPIELHFDEERFERMFCGGSYAEDYKILIREIRKYRENIPPLINSYMSLSPSMKVFGTVDQPRFRLCRGNRHPDHDQRHISEEIAAAFPIRSLKPSADSFRFRYGKDFSVHGERFFSVRSANARPTPHRTGHRSPHCPSSMRNRPSLGTG